VKNVLITGGAGFIGSHLAEALLARGCHVTIIDDLSTGSAVNLDRLDVEFTRGLVQFVPNLQRIAAPCDTVFHLASRVGVMATMGDPAGGLIENVQGAEAIARVCKGKRLIITSSSEVYGNGQPPFSEDSPIVLGNSPRWSYAVSKLALEHIALASDARTTVCRLFNTVGPRQVGKYGMVLPRFVQWALRGEPLQVYGDGTQTRCFCNVADTVRALIALVWCDEAIGEIVNVGSDVPVEIYDMATKVGVWVNHVSGRCVHPAGAYSHIPYADAYGPDFEDTPARVPDVTKIGRLTGWKADIPLDKTIREVINYEKAHCECSVSR